MRHTIFLFCWLGFSASVRAAEPTPAPKPEVRPAVKQLLQSSPSAKTISHKRTEVKDSNDRHANVERSLPSPKPSPKRPAITNVRSDQKPAPSATPRSKVKTSEKKHDAMQRYLR